jgi:hypothetical protein
VEVEEDRKLKRQECRRGEGAAAVAIKGPTNNRAKDDGMEEGAQSRGLMWWISSSMMSNHLRELAFGGA